MRTFLTTLALLAAFGLATAGLAHAGEDCCGGCDKAKAKTETATQTPIHSMMKWVASQVAPDAECGCPSTPAGEKAWRAWYAAKGGALAELRTAMVKDGWNADRTIGFFKAMAAQKSCGSCDKSKKTSGAAAPTGDAGTTGDAKSKDCSGCCDKSKAKGCCGGCDKSKKASGAAAPTGDAGTTGDAKGKDCSGCCDKNKAKGCCGGCDKSKKASGAAAPTGDAGATGDAKGGCCDGGKTCDCCGGCDKAKTVSTATKSPIHTMMKWVGSQVAPDLDCACPAEEKGEMAWRAWYAAKDAPLSGLRAAMVKDGWNADRTVAFFKAMASKKSCSDCKSCDKSSAKGAAAPTGDAGTTGDSKCPCTGKPMKDCNGCDKSTCPCGKKETATAGK